MLSFFTYSIGDTTQMNDRMKNPTKQVELIALNDLALMKSRVDLKVNEVPFMSNEKS